MQSAALIFPHQLFQKNPCLAKDRPVYLVEEWLFFRQYTFHKKKLLLHRASMRFYHQWLITNAYQVDYIETTDQRNDVRLLIIFLAKQGIQQIHITDPSDNWLLKRIKETCLQYSIELLIEPSSGFLNTMNEVSGYFDQRKKYFQTDFYTQQRKLRNILIEPDGKPSGGKWTFDAENRQRFPKNEKVPLTPFQEKNEWIVEAEEYVNKHFPDNYGKTSGPYLFATTYEESERWLDDFIQHRLHKFGDYEDAIVANASLLYHSALTPMLNIGLLTPQLVLQRVLVNASETGVPLNSLEGFVRQIIGWREYIRIVYEREGSKQRTYNFWQFKRKIPERFWKGSTGIPPIDITIQKILETGYCHHIERLMVLGNFMLLCEFDPDEVYRWFMELFIDAYDWVMVPNVYGMTQFADGGLITTKPYISGSNYLMKMSDYEKGDWQSIWDGLFWRFMHTHRNFFLQNPRLGMLVGTFDKMTKEKQEQHLLYANNFLAQLDK